MEAQFKELARLMKIKNQLAIASLIFKRTTEENFDLPAQEVVDHLRDSCNVAFRFLQLLCEGHYQAM